MATLQDAIQCVIDRMGYDEMRIDALLESGLETELWSYWIDESGVIRLEAPDGSKFRAKLEVDNGS